MRLIFMGTPDFSVETLQAVVDAGHEVVGVFTQPDKPKGRSKELVFSPVKERALQLGLSVYQPIKVREQEWIETIADMKPEAIIVVAFGQILPKAILDIPQYGCINVHASLLPKYRGAAPIQQAVIDGEEKSGVTTMLMDVGVDTGDILLKSERVLDIKETGGSLFDKLSVDGAKLLVETLKGLQDGTITPVKQDESKATHVKMLSKEQGLLDFNSEAKKIECLIRGLNPWPSAYAFYNGKTMKIWDADVVDIKDCESIPDYDTYSCGQIVLVTKDSFVVKCQDMALKINELQLEGKKRMDTKSFLLGTKLSVGEFLCQK